MTMNLHQFSHVPPVHNTGLGTYWVHHKCFSEGWRYPDTEWHDFGNGTGQAD